MSNQSYAYIQMEMGAGCWRTCNTVMNHSQFIVHAMKNLKTSNPAKRVRAVDQDGRLLDMS